MRILVILSFLFLLVLCSCLNQPEEYSTDVTVLSKTIAGDSLSGYMYIIETDKGTCLAGSGGWAYSKMIIGHQYHIVYTMYGEYKYIEDLTDLNTGTD